MTDNSRLPQDINGFPLEPVPEPVRSRWPELTLVWAGFVLCTTNFLTGSSVSYGLDLTRSLLALLVGNTILALIAISQGLLAQKTGYSVSYLTRFCFGKTGAKLISFLLAVSFIGWAGVGIGLTAETIRLMIDLPFPLISIVCTVLFALTALWGFKGMAKVSAVGIPIVLFITFFGLYQILISKGITISQLFATPPYDEISFGQGVSITIGSWIVGAIAAPDILRYSRKKSDVFISMIAAFMILGTLQMGAGAAMGLVARTWDLPLILQSLGFGVLGLILLLFISWSTADNNFYAAGLGLSTFMGKKARFWPTLICVILGGLMATLGIYSYFAQYLVLLSIVIPPIGGIMIVDTWIFQGKVFREEVHEGISWKAFAAMTLGILLAFYIPVSVPFLISMLLSAVIYWILKSTGTKK